MLMKKIFALLPAIALFASCETHNGADTTKDSTKTSTAKLDYPYTVEHPDQWERGDPANSLMVLKSLKAFEAGNIDECVNYFADSVQVNFDNYEAKLSRDSLRAMFKQSRDESKGLEIKMGDWESVVSKDTKEQYVSLWYKELRDGKNGKRDSLSVMDDLKIEYGKIVELDQKTRHYPAKKM